MTNWDTDPSDTIEDLRNFFNNVKLPRPTEATIPPQWKDGLPPLGNALLTRLIEQYGEGRVAFAAQLFASKIERRAILKEAREEVERQLEVLK